MGTLQASLQKIFPADNFALLAAILLLPLLGAIINGIFGKRLGKQGVTLMALAAVGGSFLLSVITFLMLASAQAANNAKEHGTGEHALGQAARFVWRGW